MSQDDFDPNAPPDDAEEELPSGMRIVEGDDEILEDDDAEKSKKDGEDAEEEEPPLNLNEEWE